jgi:hypothetical protein
MITSYRPKTLQDVKHNVRLHKYDLENYLHAIYNTLKRIYDKSSDINRDLDALNNCHEDILNSECDKISSVITYMRTVELNLEYSNCGGKEYYTSKLKNLKDHIILCEHDLELIVDILNRKKSINHIDSIQIKNIKN